MCHFITATMGPPGNESIVRRLARGHLLRWESLENPGVEKQLREGERYFLTTRGTCDCGTRIGTRTRSVATHGDDLSESNDELHRWIEFVTAVMTSRHAGWIGLLLHWYNGDVRTEAIRVNDRRFVRLADLTEEYLLNMEEDVLHTITLNGRASSSGISERTAIPG
jgi:hypothetical protein